MNITNEQIEKAFEGTRFGTTDYRGLIEKALWQVAEGYSTGHTIAQVCNELGLMTFRKDDRRLTKNGIQYLKDSTHRAALTSLLEELPEVDKLPNNHNSVDIGVRLGAIDYRNEIKSLIQNKLK